MAPWLRYALQAFHISGVTLDQDGRDLTVLKMFSTVQEAEEACEQRAAQQSSSKVSGGLDSIASFISLKR